MTLCRHCDRGEDVFLSKYHTVRLRSLCRRAHIVDQRSDADPRGIGLYGFSKGANAGLIAADDDPIIRCAVTDGAFGTYSVVVYNDLGAFATVIPLRMGARALRRKEF